MPVKRPDEDDDAARRGAHVIELPQRLAQLLSGEDAREGEREKDKDCPEVADERERGATDCAERPSGSGLGLLGPPCALLILYSLKLSLRHITSNVAIIGKKQ